MKINKGNDWLIPCTEWVDASQLQGDEIKTLTSPIVEKAFQKILELYHPKHKVALVSLCTATRPYSKSRKWSKFIHKFGDLADMIVCSNGGIIPLEFENCYPYLTYDAHRETRCDKIYINTCYRRLMEFFCKFHYDKIIFNFRPGMRNTIAARLFLHNYKGNSSIFILPTETTYNQAKKAGFPAGKMYPDLDVRVLKELETFIS